MNLYFRKKPQPHCAGYCTCNCVDDPKTIWKHVFIELTSKCNFNCDFCVYHLSKRSKGFMSLELLEKTLKDLKKLKPIEYVFFSPLGEPLLYPNFEKACKLVKKYGYRLIVTTNGSLLSEKHLKLPIDILYISLQTPTKLSFKSRRADIDFDKYLDKICNFTRKSVYFTAIYLLKENKLTLPNHVDLIGSKNSIKIINEIGKKIDRKFKTKIKDFTCFDYFNCFLNIKGNKNFCFRESNSWSNTIIPKNMKVKMVDSVPKCAACKHQISVLYNGDVTFCCGDFDGVMSLGNVKEESLKKIYSKKKNINLSQFTFCRKCMGTLIPKTGI